MRTGKFFLEKKNKSLSFILSYSGFGVSFLFFHVIVMIISVIAYLEEKEVVHIPVCWKDLTKEQKVVLEELFPISTGGEF